MPRARRILSQPPLARGGPDRHAELRSRPGLVGGLLADAATRVLPLREGRVPVDDVDGTPRLRLRGPVPEDEGRLAFFLGKEAGTAYLAVVEPAPDAGEGPDQDGAWAGLRRVGATLPGPESGLLVTAVGLANWHATHTHCPRCGAPTEPDLGGWIRRCPRDGSEHYPRTDPAVIMSVVDDDDRILLARGAAFTRTGMSVLAGFVEPGESLAAAVAREVLEEVGVHVTDPHYLGDQPWPFPSSLMVGFRSRALDTELRLQDDEIASARWFSRAELDAAIADGTLHIPQRISIARSIIEEWYGGPIDAPEVNLRPS